MGARQEDLRAFDLAADLVEVSAHAIVRLEVFARDTVIAPNDAFGAAEINDHVPILNALHNAVDNLAFAILVFIELALALGIAHFLHDDLFRRLRGDAAKIEGRKLFLDLVAKLEAGIHFLRIFQRNLLRGILNLVVRDNGLDPPQALLAGLVVDDRADIVLLAVAGLGGFFDRFLHRLNDDGAVDGFFFCDRFCDLHDFQPVCGNANIRHGFRLPSLDCLQLYQVRLRPSRSLQILHHPVAVAACHHPWPRR